MNENTKKALLIGVIIVAIGLAAWQIKNFVGGEQVHVEAEYKVAPGHKSEKQQALDAQAANAANAPISPSDQKSEADKDAALAGN